MCRYWMYFSFSFMNLGLSLLHLLLLFLFYLFQLKEIKNRRKVSRVDREANGFRGFLVKTSLENCSYRITRFALSLFLFLSSLALRFLTTSLVQVSSQRYLIYLVKMYVTCITSERRRYRKIIAGNLAAT